MATDAPTAPDSQGYSPNAPVGQSAPGAGAPDVTPKLPASVTGPSSGFAPQAFGSAGDAIKSYQKATLAATAAGGMQQQRDFINSHQAAVDARTGAMAFAAQRAQSSGTDPTGALSGALQAQAAPGMGIRIQNMDNHQADFKAAASARNTAFSNYMKEVAAAIPAAQAAAQQTVATKLAAQKQTNLSSQLDTATSVANQNMADDKTKYEAGIAQSQPQLAGLKQTEDNLNMQLKDAQQTLGEMAGAKKAGIGNGPQGMKLGGALTAGATFDQNRYDRVKKQIADIQQRLTDIGTQRSTLTAALPPAPKGLTDYLGDYAGKLGGALGGKIQLSLPSIATGQERLTKANAPGDVTHIMTLVPGIKVSDANAVLNDPEYGKMKASAEKGLTMALDDRGRLPGTQDAPWQHFVNALNASGASQNVITAIMKEYQPRYVQAGRNAQRTAKQQTARK